MYIPIYFVFSLKLDIKSYAYDLIIYLVIIIQEKYVFRNFIRLEFTIKKISFYFIFNSLFLNFKLNKLLFHTFINNAHIDSD